jgi:hypothetical protein
MSNSEWLRALSLSLLSELDRKYAAKDAQCDVLVNLDRRRSGVVYARLGLVSR